MRRRKFTPFSAAQRLGRLRRKRSGATMPVIGYLSGDVVPEWPGRELCGVPPRGLSLFG
jgi:hypothetical protein